MDLSHRHLPWKLERQLRDLAGQFRRRQIFRAWIRLAIAGVAGLPALGIAIHLLSSTAIPLIVPLGLFIASTALLWWRWVHGVIRKQPTRTQIALYIDEQHPELEDLAVSSVAFSDTGDTTASDWLIDRFFEHARTAAGATRIRDLVNHRQLRRQLIGLCASWGAVLIVAIMMVGRWDLEWIGAELFARSSPPPIDIAVEPGDIRVRHGADQVVWLTTSATSETVAIRWRIEEGAWVSNALQPSRSENVFYHTFTDIQSPITYQVQAAGSQSPLYRIDVRTPPEVAWIDAVYRYPEYTGQPSKSISAIRDIEGPVGTTVELTLHTTRPVASAELTFTFAPPLKLEPDGPNTLAGEIEIGENDTFRVALENTAGNGSVDERPYAITARWDEVPEIRIAFPRGDDEATAIEEVPFAFSVKDDCGIWQYGIQYEIAGRDPERRTLGVFSRSQRSVDATDLLSLEDLDLQPGDFLTWYMWADDGNPDRTAYDQLSDPFFLEIRPFRRTFSEAVSNAGQQGTSQQDATDQKQIIIATWNLRKSSPDLADGELDERRDAIITAQQNVLAGALEALSATPDGFETVQRIRTAAGAAIRSLSEATWPDAGKPLTEALRHEQIVHRLLLSLAPDDLTIGQRRAGSGGRGGGRARNRELDALDLTRRTDFAEEASTQSERLGQTEEVRKGIEDLARRQTFINRDVSQLVSEQKPDAKESEHDRRLERLIDEQRQNLSSLEELAGDVASGDLDRNQTRQAREGLAEAGRQMRKTLRDLEQNRVQRARASGSGALRELSNVEEQLGALSQRAAAERLSALSESMDRLAEQQKQILEEVRGNLNQPAGPKSIEQALNEPLMDQKSLLAESFKNFMNEAGELAQKAEAEQGLASRRLNDWLRETSRDAIYEDIERGKNLVKRGIWEAAERHEQGVLEKLENAQKRLETVTEGLVAGELAGIRRALARVERLVPPGDGPAPLSDPGELSGFLEEDYRDWVADIRSAESLLGENTDVRRNLTGIREDIDRLRRRYRRDKIPPRYELVYNRITRPLQLAAEELKREIARETGEYNLGIERLDAVPERYRKQVADYFKALAEIKIPGDR